MNFVVPYAESYFFKSMISLLVFISQVNISPSLHSSSPLDLAVKGPMVRDLMNMAGHQIPCKLTPTQQVNFSCQFMQFLSVLFIARISNDVILFGIHSYRKNYVSNTTDQISHHYA